MGQKAAQDLQGASYEKRWEWIENVKSEGNELFKKAEFPEAIDKYTGALCGLDFGKDITPEQKSDTEKKLKVPILNNMALCLINDKKPNRALQMLELVLQIDPSNEKALLRQCGAHIDLVEFDKASKVLKQLDNLAF